MTLQKVMSVLMAAFFVAFAGTGIAASPSPVKSQGAITTDQVGQTTTPLDCKKNPKDPRCQDKK